MHPSTAPPGNSAAQTPSSDLPLQNPYPISTSLAGDLLKTAKERQMRCRQTYAVMPGSGDHLPEYGWSVLRQHRLLYRLQSRGGSNSGRIDASAARPPCSWRGSAYVPTCHGTTYRVQAWLLYPSGFTTSLGGLRPIMGYCSSSTTAPLTGREASLSQYTAAAAITSGLMSPPDGATARGR